MVCLRERIREASLLIAAVVVLAVAGCTQSGNAPSDQQLQQQAASDANHLHHDLKQAGAEAQDALLQARRETKDAVAGAREGWDRGTGGGSGALDINHASLTALETLPGIHSDSAHAIIAGRPYASAHELATRGLLSRAEYARIAGLVTAH